MGGMGKILAKLRVSYGSRTRLGSSPARDLGSPGLCRVEEAFQDASLAAGALAQGAGELSNFGPVSEVRNSVVCLLKMCCKRSCFLKHVW